MGANSYRMSVNVRRTLCEKSVTLAQVEDNSWVRRSDVEVPPGRWRRMLAVCGGFGGGWLAEVVGFCARRPWTSIGLWQSQLPLPNRSADVSTA